MARRRKTDSQGVSMDSLMDTLTNVVGILMIILILIQLNVSQAIVKIISDIPPIDAEQFEELELNARAAAMRFEERKNMLREAEENRTELTTVRRELADLQAQLEDQDAELLAREQLLEQRRKTREALAEMRDQVQQLLSERNRLQQLLAETSPEPPPARVVTLPSARSMPSQAKVHTFFITGGRIYPVNSDAIEQVIMAEINRNISELRTGQRTMPDGSVLPVLDPTKLHRHFEELEMRAGPYHVRIPLRPTHERARYVATPVEGAGMEIDGRLLADFPRLLRTMHDVNTVIWFRVTPDSFAYYDRAREIVERSRLLVGWEPINEAQIAGNLNQFFVERLRDPPPPRPAPPPDPDAIRIPPPRPSLD